MSKFNLRQAYLALFGIIFLLNACSEAPKQGALVMTFDDTSIGQWYSFYEKLKDLDYKATYYVSNYVDLPEEAIKKLQNMQKHGHEIASKGMGQQSVLNYDDDALEAAFIPTEINPALEAMAKDGFAPESYAYPFGEFSAAADELFLKQFSSVRKVAYCTTFPIYNHNVALFPLDYNLQSIEIQQNQEPYMSHKQGHYWAAGIDNHFKVSEADIFRAIDSCAANNRALILLSHELGNDKNNEWQTDIDMLERVIRYAAKKGLAFKTISELPGKQIKAYSPR